MNTQQAIEFTEAVIRYTREQNPIPELYQQAKTMLAALKQQAEQGDGLRDKLRDGYGGSLFAAATDESEGCQVSLFYKTNAQADAAHEALCEFIDATPMAEGQTMPCLGCDSLSCKDCFSRAVHELAGEPIFYVEQLAIEAARNGGGVETTAFSEPYDASYIPLYATPAPPPMAEGHGTRGWDKSWYGYTRLFNAIADAVKLEKSGAIAISVRAFEESMMASTPANLPPAARVDDWLTDDLICAIYIAATRDNLNKTREMAIRDVLQTKIGAKIADLKMAQEGLLEQIRWHVYEQEQREAALLAQLSPAAPSPAASEGPGVDLAQWQLVPREPTLEMKEAWGRYKEECARDGTQKTAGGHYRAMLAAAPEVPSQLLAALRRHG